MAAAWAAVAAALLAVAVGVAASCARAVRALPRPEPGTVGFFHPFADGGGGGERVLWVGVRALQRSHPALKVFVYARAGVTAEQLARGAAERFGIELPRPIEVVPLARASLLEPKQYPRFTMLRQALGAARLGWDALSLRVPALFVDTTGWAPTYPLARAAGAKVAAYVHYPTVSTDMLGRVWARAAGYNNDAAIAGSWAASAVKAAYYRALALAYGACGAFADVAMVNSSWTAGHIRALWWRRAPPERVYPPCDTAELRRLPLDRRLKHLYLVSVAQFRPEKNHKLQLDAYALARRAAGADEAGRAVRVSRVKFIGGVRGPDDAALLAELQDYADQLGLGAAVEWRVNAPHAELVSLLGGAVGGLHSMVDEHFGIGVVEYMAAGAVPIAHDSGGPRADIVVPLPRPAARGRNDDTDGGAAYEDAHGGGGGGADDDGDGLAAAEQQQQQLEQQRPNGYLARTVGEYADAITAVLSMGQARRLQIAAAAQARAARFSTEAFEEGWLRALAPVLPATEQERAGAAGAGRGGSSGARHAAAAAAAAKSGEDEGVDAGSSSGKKAAVLLDGTAAAAQAQSPSRSPATRRSARRA